jgi:hypothetical protein
MRGGADKFDASFKCLPIRIRAGESRKKRVMDIDDACGKCLYKGRGQDTHDMLNRGSTYKKTIFRGVDMFAERNDIQLLLRQHAGDGSHESNLVPALNDDDHSDKFGILAGFAVNWLK